MVTLVQHSFMPLHDAPKLLLLGCKG